MITHFEDLEPLSRDIERVRSKLRQKPQPVGMFAGQKTRDAVWNALFAECEAAYDAHLPKQIQVSKETGEAMLALFTEMLEAKMAQEEKRLRSIGAATWKLAIRTGEIILDISPITFAKLIGSMRASSQVNLESDITQKAIYQKLGQTMATVLKSYQLVNINGNYVLQRGNWGKWIERKEPGGPAATMEVSHPGVLNVGVAPSLVSAELQQFLRSEIYVKSEQSSQIGQW